MFFQSYIIILHIPLNSLVPNYQCGKWKFYYNQKVLCNGKNESPASDLGLLFVFEVVLVENTFLEIYLLT